MSISGHWAFLRSSGNGRTRSGGWRTGEGKIVPHHLGCSDQFACPLRVAKSSKDLKQGSNRIVFVFLENNRLQQLEEIGDGSGEDHHHFGSGFFYSLQNTFFTSIIVLLQGNCQCDLPQQLPAHPALNIFIALLKIQA